MRTNRKGQVLVIASLAIALTILTTQAYIYSMSRTKISPNYVLVSDYILSIEQGSRHTVTASLINISRGGEAQIFENNLDRWETFVAGDYRFGRCDLKATQAFQAPYSDGIWLDWGVEGKGVSSGYVSFTLNLSGQGVKVNLIFAVNITTRIRISGSYIDLGGNLKDITVTVELFNEDSPALYGSITLEYLKSSKWEDPTVLEGYQELDYGNGTYRYTFTDIISGNSVPVRCLVYDYRGILVKAEATLKEG